MGPDDTAEVYFVLRAPTRAQLHAHRHAVCLYHVAKLRLLSPGRQAPRVQLRETRPHCGAVACHVFLDGLKIRTQKSDLVLGREVLRLAGTQDTIPSDWNRSKGPLCTPTLVPEGHHAQATGKGLADP